MSVLKEAAASYGEMNKLAHVAVPDVLGSVLHSVHAGGTSGVSPTPVFQRETARNMYALHVYLCFLAAFEAIELVIEMYSPTDDETESPGRLLGSVMERLKSEGFLTS